MSTAAYVSGIPIQISDTNDSIIYDDSQVVCSQTRRVPLREIIPTLLNKALRYPEVVYEQHQQVVMKEDLSAWPTDYSYDLIYLPSGLLGIEYIKTHIFYMPEGRAKSASLIHVLSGKLTVILQKNKKNVDRFNIETHIEDARLVDVKQGDKLAIPAGYFYTFVNTDSEPALFARSVKKEHKIDYSELKRENGLGYYIIAKNARMELVTNPRYRSTAEVKEVCIDEINSLQGYSPDPSLPLYDKLKTKQHLVEQLLG